MAWYAIGDIQGCHDALVRLLAAIRFDAARDRLWLVGDLVNRGPESAQVLRTVRALGAAAVSVLGNHDLHLLAVASGARGMLGSDTFHDVLEAPDRDELLAWLTARPLLVSDEPSRTTMVHAGLLPAWTIGKAAACAAEVEAALRGDARAAFFRSMYGDSPTCWSDTLTAPRRLRLITNALTRMRFVNTAGCLEMTGSGPPSKAPAGCVPWFEYTASRWRQHRVLFGHWASLGLWRGSSAIGLDSGCVWGGKLSAVRLDVAGLPCTQQPCVAPQPGASRDG